MSGIEKIIARLDSDAKAACDEIIRSAEKRGEDIISAARKNADDQAGAIIADAENQAEYSVRIARSQKDMQNRQASLSAKVSQINGVIDTALDRLNKLPADEFFKIMKRLISAQATDETGVVAMLPADADAAPEGFLDEVNAVTGGRLSLIADPAIGGRGAVLRYGDIDINLTFGAIIASDTDEIKQRVQAVLFPAEV